MLTFEQFQWTRKEGFVNDRCEAAGSGDRAFVYAGGLWILVLAVPWGGKPGRYELILEDQDWVEPDLGALERRLYEWGKAEGAF